MASNDEWVVLPQTTSDGLEDYQNIQFAPFDRGIYNGDWYLQTEFNSSSNHESRSIGWQGYPYENDTIFRTGPLLDFDYLYETLNYSANVTDNTVDLYSVEYPNSRQAGVSVQADRLVVKAVRGNLQQNKKIGTLSAYGTYIDISLTVWRRRYGAGGNVEDTRIGTPTIRAKVYRPNTNDVTGVETRLEFFYTNETFWTAFFKSTLQLPDGTLELLEDPVLLLGISTTACVPSEGCWYTNYILWYPEKEYFENYLTGEPMGTGYDPIYGDEGTRGGYDENPGTHDFSSDNIVRTGNPTLSVLSPGFVNVYRVSSGLLSRLGSALFPDNPLSMDATGLSETQALLKCFRYLIDNQHNKGLIDYVVSCHILPVNVPISGSGRITAGGVELVNPSDSTYYNASLVSSAYVSKSCGSVSIPEAFGNFLDYTVKCKLYLPCYGYVDIPAEYWNGGTISVEYCFNVIDGSFVAFVTGRASHSKLNSLIGQYSGCAITHIPVSGRDYSQIVSGLISVGVGTAGTIATGHIAGLNAVRSAMTTAQLATAGGTYNSGAEADWASQIAGYKGAIGGQSNADAISFTTAGMAASQLASGLSNVLSMKPSMINNGTANASSSMMMHKTPYLIIEYPTPQFSKRYPKEMGLPLNVSGTLGQYGGMTIAENPVLDGIPCTASEKARIRSALASGLIFR